MTINDVKNSKAYISAMKALQTKVKSLEDHVQVLHNYNKETQQNQELQVEQLKTQIDQLNQQIQIERESRSLIEQSVNQEKDEYDALEKKLQNVIQQLEFENSRFKDKIGDLNEEARITQKKVIELQKIIDEQKSEIVEYCKEKQELSKMLNFLNNENDQYKSEIQRLQQQIIDISSEQNGNYKQLLDKFSQQQLTHQDKMQALENQLKDKEYQTEDLRNQLNLQKMENQQNLENLQSVQNLLNVANEQRKIQETQQFDPNELQFQIEEKNKIIDHLQQTQHNLDVQRQKYQETVKKNQKLEAKLLKYKDQLVELSKINEQYHAYNQAQVDVNQQLIQAIQTKSPNLEIQTQLSPSSRSFVQPTICKSSKNTPITSKRNSFQTPQYSQVRSASLSQNIFEPRSQPKGTPVNNTQVQSQKHSQQRQLNKFGYEHKSQKNLDVNDHSGFQISTQSTHGTHNNFKKEFELLETKQNILRKQINNHNSQQGRSSKSPNPTQKQQYQSQQQQQFQQMPQPQQVQTLSTKSSQQQQQQSQTYQIVPNRQKSQQALMKEKINQKDLIWQEVQKNQIFSNSNIQNAIQVNNNVEGRKNSQGPNQTEESQSERLPRQVYLQQQQQQQYQQLLQQRQQQNRANDEIAVQDNPNAEYQDIPIESQENQQQFGEENPNINNNNNMQRIQRNVDGSFGIPQFREENEKFESEQELNYLSAQISQLEVEINQFNVQYKRLGEEFNNKNQDYEVLQQIRDKMIMITQQIQDKQEIIYKLKRRLDEICNLKNITKNNQYAQEQLNQDQEYQDPNNKI